MKLTPITIFCLSLILSGTHFSLARKGGGGGVGKSGGSGRGGGSKTSWFNTGSGGTKSNSGQKTNQGSNTQGKNRKQAGDYPRQTGGGGYRRQYPMQGSPQVGYGGGYPGGYMNYNPNNKVLSPRLGGSFGYGGYGGGGGSLFSQSVQQIGVYPNDRSRGFGRTAVMAAAGGAVTGMALGYGLGRFPRPYFHFRSPHEECYYNHYMYRRYGTQSTDTNDYSRDYKYIQPPESYESFMDSCMKRSDIPPAENTKPKENPTATNPDAGKVNSTIKANNTAGESSTVSAPPSQSTMNQDQTNPEEADDTVSIMEIRYPALIDQIKARWCLESYMNKSQKYLVKNTAGTKGPEMGWRGFLVMFSSTVLMLLNSNMLTLQ